MLEPFYQILCLRRCWERSVSFKAIGSPQLGLCELSWIPPTNFRFLSPVALIFSSASRFPSCTAHTRSPSIPMAIQICLQRSNDCWAEQAASWFLHPFHLWPTSAPSSPAQSAAVLLLSGVALLPLLSVSPQAVIVSSRELSLGFHIAPYFGMRCPVVTSFTCQIGLGRCVFDLKLCL